MIFKNSDSQGFIYAILLKVSIISTNHLKASSDLQGTKGNFCQDVISLLP